VTIIRYAELPVIPWKNGAGLRREMAAGEFDGLQKSKAPQKSKGLQKSEGPSATWTIGLAELLQDAPFSSYPEVSRWFMPIGPGRLTLMFKVNEAHHPVELNGTSPAHYFSGDDELKMLLHDGSMKALNVMTSGNVPQVTMSRERLVYPAAFVLSKNEPGWVHFLILVNGECRISKNEQPLVLQPFDSVLGEGKDLFMLEPMPERPCELIRVKLDWR
jgi:environmental stress-induced protein Ves